MGTLIKEISIKIGTKTYEWKENEKKKDEEYDFQNIVLTQQLLSPNELSFTMEKRELDEAGKEFATTEKIMGEEVVCKIFTNYFNDNDELEQQKIPILFKGIVANVNVYRRAGPFSNQMIDVQAFSHDYLLKDHADCNSYENLPLKEIVNKTLKPYNIVNEVDPWTQEIPYTVQYNETSYQFLSRLAMRFGEWMYHNGEKLIFGQREKIDAITLEPRNDIINFRFNAEIKHHKIKHAHHDYLKYKNEKKSYAEYPELAQKENFHELSHLVWQKSAKLFKKETYQHLQCSNPEGDGKNPGNPNDELEISTHAQLYGEKTRQFVCSCSSVRSDLRIGSVVILKDYFFNDQDSDEYKELAKLMITEIVHYTEVGGEYSNTFIAYPVKSEYPPYFQSDFFPVMSPQRAKVMDNKDPEKLGRIRVQFLWQEEQDPNLMTPWIRIAQPHGGDDKGFYFIPEIDEEVMVDFENGNAEKPFVVGTLFHGKQHPGKKWPTDSNDIKAIRTRNGHTIEIHDEGKDGYIRIYDHEKENYILTFSTDDKLIKLESTGNIEMYAKKNIIMNAGGDIVSEAGHDIRDRAGNDMDSVVQNDIYQHAESFVMTTGVAGHLVASDSHVNIIADGNIYGEAPTMQFNASGVLELLGSPVIIN